MEAKPWTDAEIEWVIAGGFNAGLELRRNATLRELLALRAKVAKQNALLQAFAAHLANVNCLRMTEWGVKGLDLLVELQQLDPAAYAEGARKATGVNSYSEALAAAAAHAANRPG